MVIIQPLSANSKMVANPLIIQHIMNNRRRSGLNFKAQFFISFLLTEASFDDKAHRLGFERYVKRYLQTTGLCMFVLCLPYHEIVVCQVDSIFDFSLRLAINSERYLQKYVFASKMGPLKSMLSNVFLQHRLRTPNEVFFHWPRSGSNLNFCSIKIAHCATDVCCFPKPQIIAVMVYLLLYVTYFT